MSYFTGAPRRAAGARVGKRLGIQAYEIVELCAELLGAFLYAPLCIEQTLRTDHAQYLSS